MLKPVARARPASRCCLGAPKKPSNPRLRRPDEAPQATSDHNTRRDAQLIDQDRTNTPPKPHLKTWRNYLLINYPDYLHALTFSDEIGGMTAMGDYIEGLGLNGREVVASLIGDQLAESAERMFYQGFPGHSSQLDNEFTGFTDWSHNS